MGIFIDVRITLIILICKISDCALVGTGGCRGQGWDNGEWPILLKGQKSLSECCKECTKKLGCSSFHIGKLREEKGDCFLFAHTAIVPVKSLGGECYKTSQGKLNFCKGKLYYLRSNLKKLLISLIRTLYKT